MNYQVRLGARLRGGHCAVRAGPDASADARSRDRTRGPDRGGQASPGRPTKSKHFMST